MRRETAAGVAWPRLALSAITAWWVAVVGYAAAIFLASSTPEPLGIHGLPSFADKVIHAAVFGGFSFTVWMAFRRSAPRASAASLSRLAILIATLYGLSDEIHQSFVPGRSMDGLDVLADGIGACLVQWTVMMRLWVRRPADEGCS